MTDIEAALRKEAKLSQEELELLVADLGPVSAHGRRQAVSGLLSAWRTLGELPRWAQHVLATKGAKKRRR